MPWYARGKVKDIKPWPSEEKVLKKHGRPSGLHMVQVEWAWDGPQSPKTHEVPSHALARPDEYDAVLEGVRAAGPEPEVEGADGRRRWRPHELQQW